MINSFNQTPETSAMASGYTNRVALLKLAAGSDLGLQSFAAWS